MKGAFFALGLAACTPAATQPEASTVTLPTTSASAASSVTPSVSDPNGGFAGSALVSTSLVDGRLSVVVRDQGKGRAFGAEGLPADLAWTGDKSTGAESLRADYESLTRPDGERDLLTLTGAAGPVLLVGHNYGTGQKLLGKYSFAAGKVLAPAADAHRQLAEAVLSGGPTPVTLSVRRRVVVEGWQVVVTQSTVGGNLDGGPPFSVDFVMIKAP